ncbi:MAG: HD domain-containing protein [Candidatus Hermodarchaeota archaeon]
MVMTIIEMLDRIKKGESEFPVKAQLQVLKSKRIKTKEGNLLVDLVLRDTTGIYPHFWSSFADDTELAKVEVGNIVYIEGEYKKDLDGVIITNIEKLEEFDLSKFVKLPDLDANELFSFIEKVIEEMENQWLKQLLTAIFEDRVIRRKFIESPSAVKYHHAYLHGNLEHTVGMLKGFNNYCLDFYGKDLAKFDKELINAGIILQDIGKIYEYGINNGLPIYVEKYALIGHIVLGSELVAKKISAIPDFPEDLELKLKHIILSHHGRKEWGSPVEPAIPEAHIVHSLDLLDSRLKSL